MNRTITLCALTLLATVSIISFSHADQAAPAGPANVALASPNKILKEMAETQDLQAKQTEEINQFKQTDQQKKTKIEDMKQAIMALKPDSAQFGDKRRELFEAQAQYQAWGQITQAELQAKQKTQLKALFDKIQIATAQLAQQKGYDLVLADAHLDLPDNLEAATVEQVSGILHSRNILFASPRVDISDQVAALLDAQYKAGK